jgi:hypothetical protein
VLDEEEAARTRYHEAVDALKQDEHGLYLYHGRTYEGVPGELWSASVEPLDERWPRFVRDIARRTARYKKLSDLQAKAVIKAIPEHRAKKAKWKAEREAEQANAMSVPTGKASRIAGKIISVKDAESPYGSRLRMLVKADEGFKVYGTVPSTLLDGAPLIGRRVEFVADIKPSRQDEYFGFFSRPRRATFIN